MFFPIFVPNGIKGNNEPAAIETLKNYTTLSDKQFYAKLMAECSKTGISSALDYATKWHNFDFLKEELKVRFVKEIEHPEYFTIKASLKRLFNFKK